MITNEVFHPDHIEEHIAEIKSLIGHEQGRLVKEGWGKGPAYYQACENVGREHFQPPIGGPKLASKVGVLTMTHARDVKYQLHEGVVQATIPASSGNGSINLVIGDVEDIPIQKERSRFDGDPNVQRLKSAILAMSIGKALPVMFENKEIARKTCNRMYAWAAQIHSKDNGWILRAPSTDDSGGVKFLKAPYHEK